MVELTILCVIIGTLVGFIVGHFLGFLGSGCKRKIQERMNNE
jgi:ABC-type dipeptide/oligopeptide/nickel transport system permease subunit